MVVGLGLCALACIPNTSSAGTGSGGTPLGDEGTTAGLSDGATAMVEGTGVADGSATGGSSNGSGATAPGSDDGPATTMPPDGTDGGGATTTSDDGPDESSSGQPEPMQEVLERANLAACSVPLWCLYGYPDPYTPWGNQQMWIQECFNASLPTPFALTELEFVVGATVGTPDDVRVQVYSREGANGRGPMLAEQPVGFIPAPGLNTVTLNPPLVLNQQNICIGVASLTFGAALGVAVDQGSSTGDTSYFRLEGDCNYGWTDVYDIDSSPNGDWCIRGTIEELP